MQYDLTGKRVYVAGHNGMVGSAVVRRLEQEGCDILTASRDEVDLCNQKAVQSWFSQNKPDAVIMAAARVGGISDNDANSADFITDNLSIQTHIIQAAHENKAEKLVFLGSSCIYPKNAENPIPETALMTGVLEKTNEAYAIAKIAGIKMVQAYRKQYGCDFISVMPCNLYGPGDTFDLDRSHVMAALIMKAHEAKQTGEPLSVWGSGKPRREFMHVDDAADGIVFALKYYSDAMPLNMGVGEDVAISDLATMIADIAGLKTDIMYDQTKPDGTLRKLMDSR